MKILEKEFLINDEILTFDSWQFILLLLFFISSFIIFFFNIMYAFIVFSLAMILSESFKKKKFRFKNVQNLIEFLKNENYRNSRRNAASYNRTEIKEVIKNIFSDSFDIEKSKFKDDSILFS